MVIPLTLELMPSNKNDYLKFKKQSHNNIDPATKRLIAISDTSFIIPTAKAQLIHFKEPKFKYDESGYNQQDKRPWTEFIGFVKPLNLYVIENWSVWEDIGFGSISFIDSVSGSEYNLSSAYTDGGYEKVVFSPNDKYIAYYGSMAEIAEIGVLEVIPSSKGNVIREHSVFERIVKGVDNTLTGPEEPFWDIEDLVWIDDNSFAVKVKQSTFNFESDKWDIKYIFLKSTLPHRK